MSLNLSHEFVGLKYLTLYSLTLAFVVVAMQPADDHGLLQYVRKQYVCTYVQYVRKLHMYSVSATA